MRHLVAGLLALALAGCGSAEPRQPQPPKHRAWDDGGPDPWDHPEPTTRPPRDPGPPGEAPPRAVPARPNVKVELTVVDVLAWDEVKIRGGVRGSVVRGIVSLTGWLAGGKPKGGSRATTSQFVVAQAGSEASLEVADPAVRELCGGDWSLLRIAVIEANDRGEIDLAIDPLVSESERGRLNLATRVRVSAGEALVIGGHRTDEADGPADRQRRDQLVILQASVLR